MRKSLLVLLFLLNVDIALAGCKETIPYVFPLSDLAFHQVSEDDWAGWHKMIKKLKKLEQPGRRFTKVPDALINGPLNDFEKANEYFQKHSTKDLADLLLETELRHFYQPYWSPPACYRNVHAAVETMLSRLFFLRPAVEKRKVLKSLLRSKYNDLPKISPLLFGGNLRDNWDPKFSASRRKELEKHTWTTGVHETTVSEAVGVSKWLELKEGETFVDLGSGFGTPGLVMGLLNPKVKVIGFDIVPEKIKVAEAAAKSLELKNVEFMEQDLSRPNFRPPDADVYFLYSPVNAKVARKLLVDLQKIAHRKPIRLAVNMDVSLNSGIIMQEIDWLKTPKNSYHRVRIYESIPPRTGF